MRALRRLTATLGVASALVLGLAACGGSDDGDDTTTTSSSVPASTSTTADPTATTATTAPTATTTAGSGAGSGSGATTAPTAAGDPGPPAPTARPAPSVTVALFAQKGETPPGQTEPLPAPAWRATGVGWDPGAVGMIVKRSDGPSVVLDIGAQANAEGRFQQTFVVLDVQPGTYAVVASQGAKRAEGSFVLS